jgi:flavin-dependent dehydrogenase
VLIAGGGPVGLGAALLATRAGLRAIVVEPRQSPPDKACGEGLMPGAVRALAALGVDPPGQRLAGIAYLAADGSDGARARFRAGPGRGVRRTELVSQLTEAVDAAGIERVHGSVGGVRQVAGLVEGGGLRSRWLLAADGLHSHVRRELGLNLPPPLPVRYGLRQHFACAPWTDFVEVHWSTQAEAYVTPVGPGIVGVAILTGIRGRHVGDWLTDFPLLRNRLGGAPTVSTELGAGPLQQRTRRRHAGRVLLVGDAGGYIDALTGEGISIGLAQAAAAVQSIREGRADRYEARWRASTRSYRVLTRAVLFAATTPAARRALVPAARSLPWLFSAAVDGLAGG